MLILVLLMFLLCISISNAATTKYSVSQLQSDNQLYLSNITNITIDSNKSIIIEGDIQKEHQINGQLINSIIGNVVNNTGYPECFIDHSEKEMESYYSFYEAFKVKSAGLDGGLLVMKWHRDKSDQIFRLKYVDENSMLASS